MLPLLLLVGALASGSQAARLGPPEGSSVWIRGQHLLERPAAALAEAVDARERLDLKRAEWLLAEVALRHPIVRDHADRMRAEIALELERPVDALSIVESSLEMDPDSPLAAELYAIQGHALARQGREDAARQAWRSALDSSHRAALRAELLLRTAESEERSGLKEEAIQTYRVVWQLYPRSEEAERASERLDVLRGKGADLRSAADWRRRADSLFRERRNPEALEAYDRALALELPRSQVDRAGRRRAQTLFRLRRYSDAVEAFAALPQKDDIPIWHARSLARADRVPEAIESFEKIASRRRDSHALRARFLAALLLDGRGETERSARYLESLTQTRTTSSVRRAALWRLGWRAYREDRYADAIGFIDQLVLEERDPIGILRSRYWRARALAQLSGDETSRASARDEFLQIALAYPLTYYGWRARLQIERMSEAVGRPPDPLTTAGAHDPPKLGPRRLSSDELARARILLEAGLSELALDELSRQSKRAGGLADRLELAQLFRSAGNFRSAQRLVVDPYKEDLARGPSATLEELWWHAWPAAFLEFVEAATRPPNSVDPALVFSIMREESGFRPAVVSPVGARGLLQIMEPTGRRLAAAVGYADFAADDLFEPEVNIRLGAHYLGELTSRFEGRLSAAIASYNAGPDAVGRWLDERPQLEDDEWIEEIPYEQTRSYVKRVLRSLQAYRLLY